MLSDDMQGQIKSMGSGATVEHMRVPDCEKLTLRLPSLPTQRRIASILSAYDDLIENNTRRMAILEEMARRIYEEWFVRFRFPGHENVRMVESELGALPEGWRHAALGSVADIQWGDTSKTKSSYSESGFDAYSASGLDGKMQTFDYERTGIVLSAIGARCGLTWFARGKWSCIKNTIRYWSLDQQVISDEFLYLATRDMAYWPRRGAAQPFISLGDAKKCSIVVSGDRLMSRFRDLSQPAMELVSVLSKMNRTLLSARDFLLPKLISGELDVSSLPKPEAAVA
jgi:type I restriction enzyme S subunit